LPGVGARTIRALAQVAEVVHGAPYRFSDPARFSVALGGKDRHPFPVPLEVYDRTIDVLKIAVRNAKLGQSEKLAAIRRLDEQARRLEGLASGPSVEAVFADERARSHEYGGRSVFGVEPPTHAQQAGERARAAPAFNRLVPIDGADTIATPPGANAPGASVAAIVLAGSDRIATGVVTGDDGARRTFAQLARKRYRPSRSSSRSASDDLRSRRSEDQMRTRFEPA
jgi:hypothetical protein